MRLHVDGRGVCVRAGSRSCRKLRQPEIKNLGMSALRDEDVCGLDVAMDNASSVCCIEPVADVNGEREKDVHF